MQWQIGPRENCPTKRIARCRTKRLHCATNSIIQWNKALGREVRMFLKKTLKLELYILLHA